MITFRLADALPLARLVELEHELRNRPDTEWRKRLEALLDAGFGACHLEQPRIARQVENALLHFDGARYHLLAWVIMPNHVHVLIETMPDFRVSDVIQSWKSFTAKEANKLLGRTTRFWQPDYFDRAIRDERHFATAVRYIHSNPVKAGLVSEEKDWRFSSAAR